MFGISFWEIGVQIRESDSLRAVCYGNNNYFCKSLQNSFKLIGWLGILRRIIRRRFLISDKKLKKQKLIIKIIIGLNRLELSYFIEKL